MVELTENKSRETNMIGMKTDRNDRTEVRTNLFDTTNYTTISKPVLSVKTIIVIIMLDKIHENPLIVSGISSD